MCIVYISTCIEIIKEQYLTHLCVCIILDIFWMTVLALLLLVLFVAFYVGFYWVLLCLVYKVENRYRCSASMLTMQPLSGCLFSAMQRCICLVNRRDSADGLFAGTVQFVIDFLESGCDSLVLIMLSDSRFTTCFVRNDYKLCILSY